MKTFLKLFASLYVLLSGVLADTAIVENGSSSTPVSDKELESAELIVKINSTKRPNTPKSKPVLAIWSTGRISFLENESWGTKVFSSNIVAELLFQFDEKTTNLSRKDWLVFDSSFVEIVRKDNPKWILSSSHPLVNTNRVGFKDGNMVALKGRSQAELLNSSTEEYRSFRNVWVSILENLKKFSGDSAEVCKLY